MKNAIIGASVGAIVFALGFEAGGRFASQSIQQRLMARVPLAVDTLAGIFTKAVQEDLSADEITNLVEEALEFMRIVSE